MRSRHNVFLIIEREYTQRVRKKGFILTTLIMPFVFLALMFGPMLVQNIGHDVPLVTVVDASGRVAPSLLASGSIVAYSIADGQTLDEVLADEEVPVVLYMGPDAVDNPSGSRLYYRGSNDFQLVVAVTDDIKKAVEEQRLIDRGIPGIRTILDQVSADDLYLPTTKISEDGDEQESDTLASFLTGLMMTFILYMFIMIYGQLVMQSIIEEKNNRVIELIVSSVRPTWLMLGKILGVGAVAVTQVLIWIAIIILGVQFVLPAVVDTADPDYAGMMAMFGSLAYVVPVLGYLLLFLIGGFLLYASIYAAIGASVDNAQDAAQLQTFAIVPLIIGFIFATQSGQGGDSTLNAVLSLVPFTSPMVMMARVPSGVPAGEIALSLVILFATIAFLVWFTAKIYRVGIFMYGKKPTLKELIRWARYK